MKKFTFATLAILTATLSCAQQKSTLAVSNITATPAIESAIKANGSISSMNRVIQSLDSNLTAAFQATRKFDVLTRSDLDAAIKEQDFANSGNVNASNANTPKTGNMKGAKYVVAVQVDDFQDIVERDIFQSLNKVVENRKIRFGAVAKVIDAESGSVVETANFIISNDGITDKDTTTTFFGGSSSDPLIAVLARNMCSQIANKVVDAIYPPSIIAKTGKTVTLNRGDGTGISVGDEYDVMAKGEEMFDPDTGDKLGFEEIKIGKIRISEVLPKFSKGQVLEDNGIEKGQLLRVTKKVQTAVPTLKPNDEI